MPLATGTWCLTELEDAIKGSFANSAAFQTWTGSVNAAEAAAHVHIDEVDVAPTTDTYSDAEIAVLFPLVVIEPDEDGDSILFQHFAGDFNQGFAKGWSLSLRFQAAFSVGTINEQRRVLKNAIGEIMAELRADPQLRIESMQPLAFPMLTHMQESEESGRFWEWFWSIRDQTGIEG